MKKVCSLAAMPIALTVTSLIAIPSLAQRPASKTGSEIRGRALRGPVNTKALTPAGVPTADPNQGGIAGSSPLTVTSFDTTNAPPFAVGSIVQNGWTEFAASPGSPQVSADGNAATGTQYYKNTLGGPPVTGTQIINNGAFSPALGAQPPGVYLLSADVRISAAGGANYAILGQAPTQGFASAWLIFYYGDFDGDTVVPDLVAVGPGPAFVKIGQWTAGTYQNVRMEIDNAVPEIRYYLNNSLIFTGPVFGGTTFEQGIFASDNFHAGEFGAFDNVNLSLDTAPPSCPGNVNGDGLVGVGDLLLVIGAWGPCVGACPPACAADIAPAPAGDCNVGVGDMLLVIGNWGDC